MYYLILIEDLNLFFISSNCVDPLLLIIKGFLVAIHVQPCIFYVLLNKT